MELFLNSFLILFFELACIRWFGSMVVYLTFFTNIVLLATFLGMSIGCLSASRGRDWLGSVMPLFLVAVVLACGVLWIYSTYARVMVDVGGQGSPQQVYFGAEAFGTKPLVISFPYVPSISPKDQEFGRLTMILSGANAPALAAINHQFEEHQSFWVKYDSVCEWIRAAAACDCRYYRFGLEQGSSLHHRYNRHQRFTERQLAILVSSWKNHSRY